MASLTNEEIIQLCDFDGEKYVQKSGEQYISALSSIFSLINRNDKPFTIDDIEKESIHQKMGALLFACLWQGTDSENFRVIFAFSKNTVVCTHTVA